MLNIEHKKSLEQKLIEKSDCNVKSFNINVLIYLQIGTQIIKRIFYIEKCQTLSMYFDNTFSNQNFFVSRNAAINVIKA